MKLVLYILLGFFIGIILAFIQTSEIIEESQEQIKIKENETQRLIERLGQKEHENEMLRKDLNATKEQLKLLAKRVDSLKEEIEFLREKELKYRTLFIKAVKLLNTPKVYSKATSCYSVLCEIVDLARKRSDSKVIKTIANLTYIENLGVHYRVVWANGMPVKINYMSDKELFKVREYVADPIQTWVNGMIGDCDDIAAAFAALFKAKGYNVTVCIGSVNKIPRPHAWIEVEKNGKKYIGDMAKVGDHIEFWLFDDKDGRVCTQKREV